MKRWIIGLVLVSNNVFADISCPSEILVCHLQKINSTFIYETVQSKILSFYAYNDDEPSLPADACKISLTFTPLETGLEESLNVAITDDFLGFIYPGNNYGVAGSILQIEVVNDKYFSIIHKKVKMLCVLKKSTDLNSEDYLL